ncbi:MAG: hypothetical protein GC152_04755 [Alphaproteobacteria bacterium]|nr:hypothetical protein [Alphaproteobacteria bacterium]
MSSSTLNDEYDEFDDLEEDDDEPGFSGLMVLLMGGLMLGAMVAVVWVAYSHGVKMGQDGAETPIVAADPNPVRVEKPRVSEDGPPRAVYDDPSSGSDETVVLADATEEPIERPALENPLLDAARDAPEPVEDAVADRIASLAQAADQDDGSTGAAAGGEADTAQMPSPKPTAKASDTGAAAGSSGQRGATPPQTAAATGNVAGGDALSGTHVVQIAALKSRAEADQAWRTISGKLGDFAAGKAPDVLPPTSASDVYYRLRIGPFASQAAAATYCEGLKERGQGCMVRVK